MRQPLLRILLQAPAQQRANVRGRIRGKRVPIGFVFQDRGNRIGDRLAAFEGLPACEHLEKDAAKCPDVGPIVDIFSADLLGAHVAWSADNLSGKCLRHAYSR